MNGTFDIIGARARELVLKEQITELREKNSWLLNTIQQMQEENPEALDLLREVIKDLFDSYAVDVGELMPDLSVTAQDSTGFLGNTTILYEDPLSEIEANEETHPALGIRVIPLLMVESFLVDLASSLRKFDLLPKPLKRGT